MNTEAPPARESPPIAAHVAAVVAKAPPLTDEARDRIAAILQGAAC